MTDPTRPSPSAITPTGTVHAVVPLGGTLGGRPAHTEERAVPELPEPRAWQQLLAEAAAEHPAELAAAADRRRQWAAEQERETLAFAHATAEQVLGAEAAAGLVWTAAHPEGDGRAAEATAPVPVPGLQHDVQLRYRHTIGLDNVPPLHLVWSCHSCLRPFGEHPVTSLPQLAGFLTPRPL